LKCKVSGEAISDHRESDHRKKNFNAHYEVLENAFQYVSHRRGEKIKGDGRIGIPKGQVLLFSEYLMFKQKITLDKEKFFGPP